MIRLSDDAFSAAREAIAGIERTPTPVQWLEESTQLSRGDIGQLSGVSGSTLRAIAQGKRPSKAQLSALKFAMLARLMGL